MPVSPGDRLGPYEILARIGAGGMGEVYQARDTRLGRMVAVKISAEQFSERFEREARAIAALNHPYICTLYDVGPNYLVMEYIEGPTLAERIRAGAPPAEETLRIASQIAEALEAAHEKGIVHRDLKPANIKFTADGKVKVLDFGLAKAFEGSTASADPASSPTLTLAGTRAGVILGTAAYMSPEQARGQPVDKRADIWSFGVVLLEMLTGRDTFHGETVSDTLASVLRADLEWNTLPATTPAAIRRLLRRCLERDRNQRLHDIADARLEIEEALANPIEAPAPIPATVPQSRRRLVVPWAVAGLLLVSTVWLAIELQRDGPPEPNVEASLLPPEKATFTPVQPNVGGLSLSPDGRSLAFVAMQDGRNMLWVRRLDSSAARPLPGTNGAYYPFWSPDSRFLAFFAPNQLKKIEVTGGPTQVLCEIAVGRGGTWSRDDVIVFSGIDRILHRVAATGGHPVPLTRLDPKNGESIHNWPWFLPDGRHFLYLAGGGQGGGVIYAGSIDGKPETGQRTEVIRTASNVVYASSLGTKRAGWLLFLRDGTLFAQRFNAATLKVEGETLPVAERVGYMNTGAFANFSVSETGVLVYGHESIEANRLVLVSRDGKQSPVSAPPGTYRQPRLSPDGTKVAVSHAEAQSGNLDIWVVDLVRGIPSRFTFDPASDVFPLWSPDGKQIAFGSYRDGNPVLYGKAANGAGKEEPLLEAQAGRGQAAYDWSRDGRYIMYMSLGTRGGPDLWVLDLKERKTAPFLATQFNESQAQFSPDGRWVAYSSDESGHYEIYVRNFTGPVARFQVSGSGGAQPRWRADGKRSCSTFLRKEK